MYEKLLVVLGVLLVSGCATGGGADTPSDAVGFEEGVELVVQNETQRLVTAYVVWDDGPRTRLGEIPRSSARVFTIRVRGATVGVQFVRGQGPQVGGNARGGARMPARRGDRLEWTLQAAGGVFFRRLSPD